MKHGTASIGLGLAFAALLLVCFSSPALSSQKQQLNIAEEKERKLLDELETLEKRVNQLEDRLAWSENKINELNKKITGGDKEKKELDRQAAELEKSLAQRLRAIYLLKDGGLLQVLLQAQSFSDLIGRYRYLSLILARDRNMLARYGQTKKKLKTKLETLEANKADLQKLRNKLSTERDTLTAAMHKKTTLLIQIHRKKELYKAMLARQETARRKLVNTMFIRRGAEDAPEAPLDPPGSMSRPEKIEPKAKKTAPAPIKKESNFKDFSKLKGKIPWPAKGRLKKKFGPTSTSQNTYKNGLLLSVGSGSRVRTIVDGQVIYTGWMNGFGNIIIVDHGKRYYSLTGGLSGLRFKVGDWVEQGEVLGTIPRTGTNAKKDIYFEIRHGGKALNPLPWLRKSPG